MVLKQNGNACVSGGMWARGWIRLETRSSSGVYITRLLHEIRLGFTANVEMEHAFVVHPTIPLLRPIAFIACGRGSSRRRGDEQRGRRGEKVGGDFGVRTGTTMGGCL